MKASLEHVVRTFYSKDTDVLNEFYIPCIKVSREYSRVTGYFSSLIFDLADSAFVDFFSAGGVMRVVCSPYLSRQDAGALAKVEQNTCPEREALLALLADAESRSSAEVLCHLVAKKMLHIKLAVLDGSDELMHEKIGIFSDGDHAVSFNGSINETGRGWGASQKESFDVFVSWGERDASRVENHRGRFEQYWADSVSGTSVFNPDKAFLKVIEEHAERGEEEFARLVRQSAHKREMPYKPEGYQSSVLECWKQRGRKGIVQFCTGAGKTVVGLLAIEWAVKQGFSTLIVVPSRTLLYQWEEEVIKCFPSSKVLKAGDSNNNWRGRSVIEGYLKPSDARDGPSVVIATLATASSNEFTARASKAREALLVADEVHNCGAPIYGAVLKICFEYRLGLSATPERYGDLDGTRKLFDFFGDVLEPVIDIPTAIEKKRLVPYIYDFRVAQLTEEEQEKWDELSKRISVLVARGFASKSNGERVTQDSDLQTLLVRRARIAKKAERKLGIALGILKENFEVGQRWLFFVEDGEDLSVLQAQLERNGYRVMVYEGDTPMQERQLIADHLALRGGIVLSMKCLDEGVDIPSISHAVILASSQNPRQFVQRRGRVLRFAGEEKRRAYIWDVMAMPLLDAGDQTRALILAEVARAVEFAAYSDNPTVVARLEAMLAEYGLSIGDCMQVEEEVVVSEES